MNWTELPEVVLGQILGYIEVLDMFCISKTCTSWERATLRPEAWKSLNISGDKLFLQISCNMMCLDEMISYDKISSELLLFLEKGSPFINDFRIRLCRQFDVNILETVLLHCKRLKLLEVSIWTNKKEILDLHLSEIIEQFLIQNHKLKIIRMYDVPMKMQPLEHALNGETQRIQSRAKNDSIPFGVSHAKTLTELWLVNSFKSHSLSNIMYLINLKELAINPQQLNYSLILHLASKSLVDLYIVANENTREFYNEALNNTQWKEIRKNGPKLRVHCYFSCTHEWAEKDTILKSNMPLASLIYRKNVWLRYPSDISHFMTSYTDTLEEFIDYSLSELTYRQGYQESFDLRIDNWIIKIARNCQKLKWLTVKEPLSSGTILLIMLLNPNITHFLVRDDMILYKNDVPSDLVPDQIMMNSINIYSTTQEKLQEKMSDILKNNWKPLTRNEYFAILNRKYKKFK